MRRVLLRFPLFCFVYILCTCIKKALAYCEASCNSHGKCIENDRCDCHKRRDGTVAWIGNDCSQRTCPMGVAWVGEVVSANNMHPMAECSNRGDCDRTSGVCECHENFDGVACERTICPNDCRGLGICYTQLQMAENAGTTYRDIWDSKKQVGCVCDVGYRGPDCSLIECPSTSDVNGGPGNEGGRDCSGRGLCDYRLGVCNCFLGYYGQQCEYQIAALS